MDITGILKIIIELVAAVIGVFLIPYIKTKCSQEQINYAVGWIKIAVAAAEQIFSSEAGKTKKHYVEKFIEGKGIKMDKADLNNAIESAVLELHNELYEKNTSQTQGNGSETVPDKATGQAQSK